MVKAHPFMPGAWQTPVFLKWLRRTHGWLGLGGAVAGVLFSITTLLMEHDDFGLNDESMPNTVETFEVPASAQTSWEDFRQFARAQVGARGAGEVQGARGEGPDYSVRFNSPGDVITVSLDSATGMAEATTNHRSFIDVINRFHRAEGVPLGWRILSDAFTGALIVLAITGVMMWTRLHGTRLLAAGLFTAMFVVGLYYMTLTV